MDKRAALEVLSKEISQVADVAKKLELEQTLEKLRVGLSSPIASVPDAEEKFAKYKEMLVKRGYFANVEEGSTEYNARLEKARVRFMALETGQSNTPASSSSPSTATPTATAPTNPTPAPEPVIVTEEQAKQAEVHKEDGNEFFKNKHFQEAIDCYTKSIQSNPSNAVVWSNRGLAHFRCSNYKACIDDQLQAIKCNPKYEKAYSRLGSAYAAVKDNKNAQKAFEDCLAVNPSDTTATQELEKLKQTQSSTPSGTGTGMPGFGPGGLPPNFMEMMNNPQFMQMASQLMERNPQLMQMAQQMATNPDMLNQFFGGNVPDMGNLPPGMPPKQ